MAAPAGYQTLVREVSDSLHLRRFCLLPLTARVPDVSTVRKLVRRLGPETVNELTRVVIGKAQRGTGFRARAGRIDSTVVEADIRYPADGVLALQGARMLAREGRKLAGRLRRPTVHVADRSRQLGRLVGRSRFDTHRGHLRAVAYRMLGWLSEADDAVQQA
jgi:IS5 family transposase